MGTRTIVITGASTGIGRHAAEHLQGLGFEVFAGVRSEVDAQTLTAAGLRPLMLDVTKPEQLAAAVDEVRAAVGEMGLAGLVNNAGVALAGPLEYVPLERLRTCFEVNVFGLLACTQAFLPLLRAGRGRVVNIGSISGKLTTPLLGPYCASKYALESLNDALRRELAPWGLHVSLLEPGPVATPIWSKSRAASLALAEALPPAGRERYGQAIAGFEAAIAKSEAGAVQPQATSEAIAHALTAKRPRTRYPVGRDARVGAVLARALSDRALDWVLRRVS